MAIYIHQENTKFHVKQKRQIKRWLSELIIHKQHEVGEINIILRTDDELLAMNQEVLNHDTYTDIITFNYNIDTEINGDLFISIDRIKENALKFAVPIEIELHRVMAHGVLHLIGYNDKNAKDQKIMKEQEDSALALYESLFHVKHE